MSNGHSDYPFGQGKTTGIGKIKRPPPDEYIAKTDNTAVNLNIPINYTLPTKSNQSFSFNKESVSQEKKNLLNENPVVNKSNEGYSKHVMTDKSTGESTTSYVKPESITRMQFGTSEQDYMKFQKNRQFNQYAKENKLIPEFNKDYKDAKSGINVTDPEMIKWYSNKSNINKLRKRYKRKCN